MNFRINYRTFIFPAVLVFLLHCSSCNDNPAISSNSDAVNESSGPLFTLLDQSKTGITFNNKITPKKDFNYFLWPSIYNGAGLAVGDLNNDGLPDIFFAGNMVEDQLYMNKGNFEFENVSATAGLKPGNKWSSGVSMVDINSDGWLDIYVCRFGWADQPGLKTNLLYINKKNGTFQEMAREYGLASEGYSIQSVFFDYDRDGDLDLYLVNQPRGMKTDMPSYSGKDNDHKYISPTTTDRLYRNDNGKFTDVTKAAGVEKLSFGLNAVASDLNEDGWPDLYVSNDYHKPDYFFINNGNGTFTDKLQEKTKHISNFAMGSDIADINNDGLMDIAVVDMQAADHYRSKTNMGSMSPARFWRLVDQGMHHQYMVNTLQLNNGNGTFSEIGQLAGVSKTDWSWALLMADFDLDGFNDIMITNGIVQDIRNNDYIKQVEALIDARQKKVKVEEIYEISRKAPSNPISNYLFKNNGDLTFSDMSKQWGFDKKTFSQGAAYADFDNDGDLDMVVNNTNDFATVYRNNAGGRGNGWFRLKLQGPKGNRNALGAKVSIQTGDVTQVREMLMTRGFMSSVEPVVFFGTGKATTIDRLTITWPDGKETVLRGVETNQTLEVKYASGKPAVAQAKNNNQLFVSSPTINQINARHTENKFDDFEREVLLPHKQSENGPYIAVADVDGNGKEDFFLGGAAGQPGTLYLQTEDGSFRKGPGGAWNADKASEDLGCLFFDADGDNDKDLYVVSGGNEFEEGDKRLQDRLYINDGKGNFSKSGNGLPDMKISGQAVAYADIDGDGDNDLFVGGRVVPGKYPSAPRSFLLMNENGRFKDVTAEAAPELSQPGMVTDAKFVDDDGDGDADLFITGEWMSIMKFTNDGGKFSNSTEGTGLEKKTGWWFSFELADADGDGDLDIFAGNLGKNSKFKATEEKPFVVFGHDFDGNGSSDIVLANTTKDKVLPVRGMECSSEQVPLIAEKFPTYHEFAMASIEEIYSPGAIEKALRYEATELRSCYIRNDGGGKYTFMPFPVEAQFAPVRGIVVKDINGDGHKDVVAAGNLYGAEVETVRQDAGTGICLIGDGQGGFSPMVSRESGLFAWGDVRGLSPIRIADKEGVIVAVNNDKVIGFTLKTASNELGMK